MNTPLLANLRDHCGVGWNSTFLPPNANIPPISPFCDRRRFCPGLTDVVPSVPKVWPWGSLMPPGKKKCLSAFTRSDISRLIPSRRNSSVGSCSERGGQPRNQRKSPPSLPYPLHWVLNSCSSRVIAMHSQPDSKRWWAGGDIISGGR